MPLPKGRTNNPAGRPKSSPNKAGGELRHLITGFLQERFTDVVQDFEKLDPKDRIKVYTDLLQYGLPKLQAVSNTIEFENMTDEQLDTIINQLIQGHEQD